MANTYDPALVVDTVSTTAKTVLANRLAALSLFSSNFSAEVKKPKDTIQVPIVSATAATQVNPTNFANIGGTTVGSEAVSLDHIYQPFGLEYADLQNAHRLEQIVRINLNAFADKIWAVATTPITTANFGAATVTKASASINPSSGDLATLWAAVSKSDDKGLIVDPTIYANLIPTSTTSLPLSEGAYGFNRGVFFASQFPSEVKLAGFACSPDALAVASAEPALMGFRENMLVSETVTLENLGLTVFYNLWADNSTRSHIASIEVMFGSQKAVTGGTIATIFNP